jgi:hypothetical protein
MLEETYHTVDRENFLICRNLHVSHRAFRIRKVDYFEPSRGRTQAVYTKPRQNSSCLPGVSFDDMTVFLGKMGKVLVLLFLSLPLS